MADPALDLATFIGANLATATLGTNAFAGPVRPPEDGYATKAVFCIEGGGPPLEPMNGTSDLLCRGIVEVRARGEKDAYGAGKTWADSIFDEVQHAAMAGYVNVRNLQAAPVYIGTDKGGRPEWTWDVELIYEV